MRKLLLFLFIISSFTACNFKKRVDHHGVHMLKKKSEELLVSKTNKNDILKILGPPLLSSSFDNDILFYIERKITTDSLIKLGKQFYLENNVLILEIDNRGILAKLDYYDLTKMQKLDFVKSETSIDYRKQSFIYDFLSSVRQKVNDPLGKREKN